MGSWGVHVYVRSDDIDAIASNMQAVFAVDHYVPTSRAVSLPDEIVSDDFHRAEHWGVVLLPARVDWTCVRIEPIHLLCGRAAGADRPRLAQLARALRTEAFQFNVYDTCDAVLLECDQNGDYAVTGSTYNLAEDMCEGFPDGDSPLGWEDERFPFFQESIAGDELQPRFVRIRRLAHLNTFLSGDYEEAESQIESDMFSGLPAPPVIHPFQEEIPPPPVRAVYFRRTTSVNRDQGNQAT